MTPSTEASLETRFQSYVDQGHLVLAVTLSTLVTSDQFARHERFRSIWDKHFMEKVRKRVPRDKREHGVDYEYIVQCSPEGFWHFHGFLAVPSCYAQRLWCHQGLNRHLLNDIKSFRRAGPYRCCRVNSFFIEPVTKIVAWKTYITRQGDSTSSFL